MELKITKTIVVKNKKERLNLNPKRGWMAVQKDEHERYYFDGKTWRLWKLGTPRHFRESGKPNPVDKLSAAIKKTKMGTLEDPEKKRKPTAYIIIAVAIAVLAAYILIN